MFLRPTSLREAVDALARPGIQILAGGTDFYPALGDRHLSAPVLDITAVPELSGIREEPSQFRIAGGTTWSELVATPLPRCFDALKAAAREVGSIQIQNRGTVAGNLCNASPAADGVPPLLALDAEWRISMRPCVGCHGWGLLLDAKKIAIVRSGAKPVWTESSIYSSR